MSELTLRLCGDVVLAPTSDGPLVPRLGGKALALLSFLALEPGAHRREALTALLWGEFPEDKAKGSLRQALTHLRAALGDTLEVGRTTIELLDPLACDVTEFLRLARQDPPSAIAVDIPHFLASLSVQNAPAFEEWAEGKRAELLGQYRQILASCTREAMARRDWRRAAAVAEQWSSLDRLADEPVAALMESLYLAGDVGAALAIHSRHTARLRDEDGRKPGEAIEELLGRIGRPPADLPRATETWYDAAPSFEASLVGRAREWHELTRNWKIAAGGERAIVLIEGEPGAGKTRMADDFLRWITLRGGVVLRGGQYDAPAGAPYGIVVDVLRSAIEAPGLAGVDPHWLAEVATLVPEVRVRFPGLPRVTAAAGADSWRLFEAIAQVLLAVSEDSPVVVLIDDLQWCDASSCAVLHSLLRRLEHTPVLWCATFSLGGVERDAPAARLIRALRAARGATSIVLAPLGEEDVWQLIRELARVDAPTGARRLAARIHDVTAGNPFYVIELLKTLFALELLTVDPDSGSWIVRPAAFTGATALVLAPTVHEAISERIECLPDELHALLISIAVAGRGCRTDVLSHLHGISRLRAAALGDGLVERHLVTEDDGLYRCAHPIIAHVVRHGLSAARRREVHRALALVLELLAPAAADSGADGEIARHAEQAGERAIAYRHAIQAAESCSQRGAFEEALSWLDLAAGTATTGDESKVVDRLTARVLEQAGWREAPPARPSTPRLFARVEQDDLDLPARL